MLELNINVWWITALKNTPNPPYDSHVHPLLKELAKSNGQQFIEIVITYIIDRGELSNKEAFFNSIQTELAPELGENIMTIAEQLRAEGRNEGREEGREITGLSLSRIRELKKKH